MHFSSSKGDGSQFGSQFDQVRDEEEENNGDNISPLFKNKAFREEEPTQKKKSKPLLKFITIFITVLHRSVFNTLFILLVKTNTDLQ